MLATGWRRAANASTLRRVARAGGRLLSTAADESIDHGPLASKHFRAIPSAHPPNAKPQVLSKAAYDLAERDMSDRMGRQQNHIWSPEELQHRLQGYNDVHVPETFSDHVMHKIMYWGLYHPFNFITGYSSKDPTPQSIEWRLIILESFAGVPGFVAAGFRHFRSLRLLKKDYGWIGTLLEEAENERMHLLVCLKMFQAGTVTRTLCIAAQVCMTPFLMAVYVVKPKVRERTCGMGGRQGACGGRAIPLAHAEVDDVATRAIAAADARAAPYWRVEGHRTTSSDSLALAPLSGAPSRPFPLQAMHRFVGYLEQTACQTYHNIISHIETPGTRLHTAWAELPAPEMAKGYWHLDDDAKWVDALKCMYADESNHRDVNHTFASMESDDPNPYVNKHKEDAAKAWKLMEAQRVIREHNAAQHG